MQDENTGIKPNTKQIHKNNPPNAITNKQIKRGKGGLIKFLAVSI
jgi:hypothetical protein